MKTLVRALVTIAGLMLGSAADAATFRCDTDPFAGVDASAPDRQIVAGEEFITFDNDNDATTPFAAGTAANLIAQQITTPGPGFFI